jgi:hypothetical protein
VHVASRASPRKLGNEASEKMMEHDRLRSDPAGHHQWAAPEIERQTAARPSTYLGLDLDYAVAFVEFARAFCDHDDVRLLEHCLVHGRSTAELRVEFRTTFGFISDEEVDDRIEDLVERVAPHLEAQASKAEIPMINESQTSDH